MVEESASTARSSRPLGSSESPGSSRSSNQNRGTVRRPSRGADRNQGVGEKAAESETHLLPSLDDGITLLDVDGGRDVPVLQSLVLDHLLLHDGPAFWVDADGHATTAALARIAPSRRLLDRIHVARGFTAYQHYGAVCDLPTGANRHVRRTAEEAEEGTSPHTPALIVAPAVDALYRADDTLGETHAETLQARALARLATYAESYDAPVLVTRSARDEFAAPVERVADHHLKCERTRMGPRIVGEEFETLVYPVDGGAYYQTTFAYWRQLLGVRAEQVGLVPAAPARSTEDTAGVGTSATADGETATFTANPLLDAWTASDTGGR